MKADALAGHAAGAPSADGADTKAHQARTAAKQLEAFFLRRLLAEARPQGGGMLDGGFAGDTFKQMLDEAIADKMTAAGGVGMATLFAKQLGQDNETAAVQPPIAGAPVTHDAAITALASHGTPSLDPATIASHGFAGARSTPPGSAESIASHGFAGARSTPVGSAESIASHGFAGARSTPLGGAESIAAPRFVMPVAGRASSGYGLRADPVHGGQVNHPGFDLAAATGTEVAAAAGGTVVHAGPAGTYGNLVTVRHENGFETRYAHLSEVGVKVGDLVQPGSQLGKVGTTGYSTGPHLHFEVRRDGQTIDPAPLLPLNRSDPRTMR